MLRARLITIVLASFLGAWTGPAQASDFSWTAGADTPAPLLDSQDADAGVVQNGANLDVQTALYPDWHRYRGSSLDNLAELFPLPVRDASFNHPNGDDAYWTNGIWQDSTGKRFAVIHIEYNYQSPRTAFLWKRRIGLATSTDQGASWHYEGDIITTNSARPGAPSPAEDFQDFGCGDTYLFVDRRHNYFYLYYMTAWVYKPTGWRTRQIMSVARCLISAKMAPGQWTKWSGGTWTQLGIGGAEDAVFEGKYPTPADSGTDSAVVHFNTYLNAFVAIGHDSDGTCWFRTASSLDSQNWQLADDTFPQRLYWYNWPIDPVTHDRYEIGQTFRLYSAQANVEGKGTKYCTLTLSKNGNSTPSAHLIQPEQGAKSFTPGPVTLIATSADSDGSVSKVEFLANQKKIGEVTTAPYVFIWKAVPVGDYRLSVRATDNIGAASESAGVDISVIALVQ